MCFSVTGAKLSVALLESYDRWLWELPRPGLTDHIGCEVRKKNTSGLKEQWKKGSPPKANIVPFHLAFIFCTDQEKPTPGLWMSYSSGNRSEYCCT